MWKAVDKKTRDVIALKKIFDAFQNSTDAQARRTLRARRARPRPAVLVHARVTLRTLAPAHLRELCPAGAQRTFREIMFLQELTTHDNIIRRAASGAAPPAAALFWPAHPGWTAGAQRAAPRRLLNVMKAENDRDIYLVFEYMETDLHAVIRANILEEIHKQYVMYQLFKALKYMHSAELLHRDIKARARRARRCTCAVAARQRRRCGRARAGHSREGDAALEGLLVGRLRADRRAGTPRSRATCCSTASAR